MKFFRLLEAPFQFLGRQLRTKTGRAGAALIAGTVANQIAPEHERTIINAVLDPGNAVFGLLAMFLRDKQAKAERRGF